MVDVPSKLTYLEIHEHSQALINYRWLSIGFVLDGGMRNTINVFTFEIHRYSKINLFSGTNVKAMVSNMQ